MEQKIGLNMYSLRELCGDANALNRTLDRVAAAGYRYVQVSGIRAVDPDDIASALHEAGLTACATHMSWDRFLNDVNGVIELHKRYGTNHAAVGSLPEEYRTADGVARFVNEAREVVSDLTAAGLDFSYHNHNHEFARSSGVTWIDRLWEYGAPVGIKFELDTYWVAAAGADPAVYVERFGEHMSICHVKDMVVTTDREQRFAPVGSGNLHWPRLFAAIRATPIEFVIVEQDAHYGEDEIENVAASFRFLTANGFSAE